MFSPPMYNFSGKLGIYATTVEKERIKRNFKLKTEKDVVAWCKKGSIQAKEKSKKKKFYVLTSDSTIIIINAYSYTIITEHKREDRSNIHFHFNYSLPCWVVLFELCVYMLFFACLQSHNVGC
jgi:hypothetical protein